MKKIISFLLAVLMVFPIIAFAEECEHEYGEWYPADEDTRCRECPCGSKDTVHRLELPASCSGTVYVENNPDGFYCGTKNAADILGICEGTFTNGEITVVTEGTNISVSGTATKTVYFDLQKGTFGVPDYKRNTGYTLPDGDYRFAYIGSGSYMPTVCIRNPDGKVNLMVLSRNKKEITTKDVKSEDFGIPYLYFPKGATYDYSGNLVLTIGAGSVYDSQKSEVRLIESSGMMEVDGYLWDSGEKSDIFGYPIELQNQKNEIICSEKYISIFLPQPDGKLEILMNFVDSDSINAYGWRLHMMYACDNEYNRLFPVTNSGEYEMAIKISGRPDFIGMGAHGSEIMTSFSIFVDGAETEPEKLSLPTEWKTLRITRESDMFDPLDEITPVGKHSVEYLFDPNGLTVNQSVEWITDATCGYSYMMMFPVRRKYGGMQITDTYKDNFDPEEYDVSEPGFSGYPLNWTNGATEMTLYSKLSGVTATMKWLGSTELPGGGYKHCANSESYNKLYFTICGVNKSAEAKTGDIWETSTRYEVTLEKPDPTGGYSHGDINLDGFVNIYDAYTARLIAAKLIKPTEQQVAVGDLDLDVKITAIDANIIRKFIAGIIKEIPVK